MSDDMKAPRSLVESVAAMRFPARTDERLRSLMDRNTEGQLTTAEREELESLAELSESLAIVRAEALKLLGRTPT
jgi:hypothetical protein